MENTNVAQKLKMAEDFAKLVSAMALIFGPKELAKMLRGAASMLKEEAK